MCYWSRLIEQTHREIDEARRKRHLPPYPWRFKMLSDIPVQDEKRKKYPFLVDPNTVFKRDIHEEIIVEGVHVVAEKRVCIKCGGRRHQLDTKGFCGKCKSELGMLTSYSKTHSEQDREWEKKKVQILQPAPIVSPEFVWFAWQSLPDTSKQMILDAVWKATPIELKIEYIQGEIKSLNSLNHQTQGA